MTHRHKLGQGFNIARMEEYVWCVECKEKWSKEEIERRLNATECLSAEDAESLAEWCEAISLEDKGENTTGNMLRNYAKTLRGE